MNLSYLIIIILLIILVGAVIQIVFANDGSYCVNDDLENGSTYLEYCLLTDKIISCSQNMTACIEAKESIK